MLFPGERVLAHHPQKLAPWGPWVFRAPCSSLPNSGSRWKCLQSTCVYPGGGRRGPAHASLRKLSQGQVRDKTGKKLPHSSSLKGGCFSDLVWLSRQGQTVWHQERGAGASQMGNETRTRFHAKDISLNGVYSSLETYWSHRTPHLFNLGHTGAFLRAKQSCG